MTLPKLYYSEQLNAPVLTREIGKLIPILDACLLTGFNSKSVSAISVTDNVGTATTTVAHGYNVRDTIEFTGADQSVFNAPNSFRVLSVPDTTSFTFAITTALTTATGTITAKISPLGWEKVYSGTNKAVYRSSDIESTRRLLWVNDTINQYAEVAMYESMTGLDSGLNKTTNLVWTRSEATTGTASRPWMLLGDERRFYWLPRYNNSSPSYGVEVYFFGDILSFKSNDSYHCCLAGSTYHSGYPGSDGLGMHHTNNLSTGMRICRAGHQFGGNVAFGLRAVPSTMIGAGTFQSIPINSNNNSWTLFPIYVVDSNLLRGVLPGMLDVFESTVTYFLPTRTFIKNGSLEVMAVHHHHHNYHNVFFSLNDWAMPVGTIQMTIGG
jgi:hypothetical protein